MPPNVSPSLDVDQAGEYEWEDKSVDSSEIDVSSVHISKRIAKGKYAEKVNGIIEAKWWTGEQAIDPSLWTIDCTEYAMDSADLDPSSDLAKRMRKIYDEVGIVHLTNTGLDDMTIQRLFALIVMEEQMNYEGGGNSRNHVEENVYEIGAPLIAALPYHHEMAYVNQSPKSLAFLVKSAITGGRGATYVSDNIAATDDVLSTPFGQKLKNLGVCYIRYLTDREAFKDASSEEGVYNHWQQSFQTEDPSVAEQRAHEKGLKTEWGPNRFLKTRYYVSAFEYFPKLDRNLLYSSIADTGMWFDSWPLIQHLPYDKRPMDMTWGDDTKMTKSERREFVELYDKYGIKLDWKAGDVAVFCNYRFLHGRPGIELKDDEERELGVLLGKKFNRVGHFEGKW